MTIERKKKNISVTIEKKKNIEKENIFFFEYMYRVFDWSNLLYPKKITCPNSANSTIIEIHLIICLSKFKLWCGACDVVMWCGVVPVMWCDVVPVMWCGVVPVVWCGVVPVMWCGVVWCGVVWWRHVSCLCSSKICNMKIKT